MAPHHRLTTALPFAWPPMLGFYAARAVSGVDAVSDRCYLRSFDLDGVRGVVRVAFEGADDLHLFVAPSTIDAGALAARLRRMLDLDVDPTPIDAHLSRDAALAPLVAVRPGLRVPGGWDSFEVAVRAILGQQVTLAAGVRLTAALARRYGDALPSAAAAGTPLTHLFPRPEQLIGVDLTSLGMPAARARALTALAARVVAEPDVLAPPGSLDQGVARLTILPGIGGWTAQYVAMRAWREPDAFPAGDVALQRALGVLLGRPVDARDLAARADGWRPWRAYAAQHLWSAFAGGQRLARQ